MIRRILRTVTVFTALVAAYQAYVLFAVPMMVPPIKVRQPTANVPGGRPIDPNPATKYQLLLANYFPRNHWTQTQPPKVFASSDERAMLVLDDYKRYDETRVNNETFTRVDIVRFALLVFPTPPREGITPPRDAILLEAPNGARLKFSDFRPELGRIGQITGGQFPGRITIRSDMHEEGPDDDLIVETADLEMNTKLLYSQKPVRFRLGQNIGGGREMELSFLIDEHVLPRERKFKISGIDTLEIRRDVRMRLQLETDSLLPGGDEDPGSHAERGNEGKEAVPVEATCDGSFTFDFVRYVASLDGGVQLQQANPNGPADQLFCKKLQLKFAPKELFTAEPQPVILDPGKRQQRDLGRLEPVALEATGEPVIVNSPLRNAQARGDHIQIGLKEQRVRLAGPREAMLVYGINVLRAPLIDYQHPARGSASPVGRFRATGPGTLQYTIDPAKPDQVFQAAWQKLVDLSREQGQPVLSLDGRPQFAFATTGSLTADTMKIYLREVQSDTPAGAGLTVKTSDGAGTVQVVPHRIHAKGHVDIQSPRLTGRTGELLVMFRPEPVAATGAASGATSAAPGAAAATAGEATTAPVPSQSLTQRLTGGAPGASQQVFHIDCDRMQLEVQNRGETAEPLSLACTGNITFREVPPPGAVEQPLEIRGAQLTVDRLDTSPYVTLRGASAAGAPGSGPELAQLAGRGVTMYVNVLELDAAENRMWSDGPGKANLLVTRDLQGQTVTAPFPVELTWQGSVQFDGSVIAFERDVVVAGADDMLKCDQLAAKLSKKIIFGETIDPNSIEISEVECNGNVILNHLTRDNLGVTSHERAEVSRLSINQQTGAITGVGPGVIRSTRFGDGLAALAGQQDPAAPQLIAPPPGAAGSKLHFLRVDFQRGLSGNMITREITFHERVRSVYGPVDSWEQELDANRPETLPPEAMTMTCDEMRVNEDPVAARTAAASGQKSVVGPIQFQAIGNVRIDGQAPEQGPFTAQAARASYEAIKETFILEGDGRTPATLWRAGQTGAPPAARRIRYVRSTGDIAVDGIQYLEITPRDVESAKRPGNVR